nr:MAG TPA: hypothetical protein [Caudoviricetes sp.]
MAKEESLIVATGYFDGHNVKGNMDVTFKMSFPEGDLPNALQFVAAIAKQVKLIAYINGNSDLKVPLGVFTVDSLRIDKNANCKIQFKSIIENCFVNNFAKLLEEEASIMLKGKIL